MNLFNLITIIHEPSHEEPFVIAYKPHNLPTAPLNADDKDNLLSYCIEKYPEIKTVNGKKEIEYGLIHRIDTVTDGLVLIACNQQFYDHIINLQENNQFVKIYKAKCIKQNPDETFSKLDFTPNGNIIKITTYFRHFGPGRKEVRPVPLNASKKILDKVGKLKEYTTQIIIKNESADNIEVECTITNGFKHQVRSHLAAIGYPIVNDKKYNSSEANGDIQFTAAGLEFDGKKWEI